MGADAEDGQGWKKGSQDFAEKICRGLAQFFLLTALC
jgi:hypothetical protein